MTPNPSPQYIADVAVSFGTNGDMAAVIRGILVHPEAQAGQKLKSPLLRTTQLLRAFNADNDSEKLWVVGDQM